VVTGIVLHPTDFANIEMLKDLQGRYLVGQVLVRGELGQQLLAPSLWGKPIAISKSETPGTALVGAFNTASQLFRRIGLLIEMTNCDADDFTRNLITIRAELRAALAVYAGNAFCEITGLP
jgi:HK97 family phage major capsid protein